jgi:hypothetical protein
VALAIGAAMSSSGQGSASNTAPRARRAASEGFQDLGRNRIGEHGDERGCAGTHSEAQRWGQGIGSRARRVTATPNRAQNEPASLDEPAVVDVALRAAGEPSPLSPSRSAARRVPGKSPTAQDAAPERATRAAGSVARTISSARAAGALAPRGLVRPGSSGRPPVFRSVTNAGPTAQPAGPAPDHPFMTYEPRIRRQCFPASATRPQLSLLVSKS